MRILQILPELRVGGVETGTVDFAKYLVEHGHVSVVVSHGGELVEDLVRSGTRHYQLPVHRKNLLTIITCIRALRKIILKEQIDIVHARSRVPGWVAYFACRGTKAEFITTCHGFYSHPLTSRVMTWAKIVIVPSEVLGRFIVENYKVSPEQIRVIPRSVDIGKFKNSAKEQHGKSDYIIATIGRLTPIKGHVYFLQAMAKIVRSMPYVKIWIIGDAPPGKESYKQELFLLVKQLGLTNHVEFLGNRRDIPQLLSQVDVFVLASVVPESFGRVVLEAQAAGIPVVATKIGGVTEIVQEEKTGLLVLPKDPDAMGEAVLRVLNDRKLARDMANAARKEVESKYTLEQMASKTLMVYQELLKTVNILVIKMSSLGDVILVTPSLKALRKKFPQARIVCLVGEESRIILQRCPYLDELIVIDIKSRERSWWALWQFARKLRKYRFDKIIDLQNNRRSHLLAALSYPRESYGYNNGKWGFFLTHAIKDDQKDLTPIAHQFRILQSLDISYEPEMFLELWPSESDRREVQRLLEGEWLNEGAQVVGVTLSASEKWETKNWPLEYIARLCDLLAPLNIRVVLTGTEKDKAAARKLIKLTRTKPVDLVGKTDLPQLAIVIKKCQVYVTPDSAPLHIAAAVGTPFVAFFGPTSSRRHLPPAKSYVVLERKLDCAPCYSSSCRIKTHLCLRDISPEEVLKHIRELMALKK
jgi:lipopolysaccharide heptosyltransferase II